MSNPFDRNKTKEARLGHLVTEPGEQNQRDAVHIAVVPCIAGCDLKPGQHVSVSADGSTALYNHGDATLVGIVDPFLRDPIPKGSTFWLCLYQGQVTTLRHEWTHPAFPSVTAAPAVHRDKAASEAWLRDFCEKNDCPGYEIVLGRVMDDDYRSDWDWHYFHFDGLDAHAEIPPEFWHHMSIVTGKTFEDPPTGFTCSC